MDLVWAYNALGKRMDLKECHCYIWTGVSEGKWEAEAVESNE